MKALVAPDKFKGSLAAHQAAEAIARGLQRGGAPAIVVQMKPIADGGEGFAEALAGNHWKTLHVRDPLGRIVPARYGWADTQTAVVATSEASGLWRLAPEERDPLQANTFGTGELIADAIGCGAERILVGLGGSATNDGGIGMAAALGYEFLTSDGEPIAPVPANLLSLIRIKPPPDHLPARWPEIIAACDVRNPLLGTRGASRVYGPQKGAGARTVETLELALENLADVVAEDLGCDFRAAPGAGAAGGLGFGLMSFCGATIRPGFELVAEIRQLDEAVASSDIIFTGEGRIDAQTLEGKGPAGIATLARKHGKPIIAFTGQYVPDARLRALFDAIIPIAPPELPSAEALRDAARLLEDAAARTAAMIPHPPKTLVRDRSFGLSSLPPPTMNS